MFLGQTGNSFHLKNWLTFYMGFVEITCDDLTQNTQLTPSPNAPVFGFCLKGWHDSSLAILTLPPRQLESWDGLLKKSTQRQHALSRDLPDIYLDLEESVWPDHQAGHWFHKIVSQNYRQHALWRDLPDICQTVGHSPRLDLQESAKSDLEIRFTRLTP